MYTLESGILENTEIVSDVEGNWVATIHNTPDGKFVYPKGDEEWQLDAILAQLNK